jgi:Fur family transcriptional regulator, peroxide stress response regulator
MSSGKNLPGPILHLALVSRCAHSCLRDARDLAKQEKLLDNNCYLMISNSDFRSLCRQHSLAATHQRRVIYEVVMSLHRHPSPERIYEGVRKKIPTISLATVYKNVRIFLDSGMLREVSFHHGSMRVEPNEHEHHHLVCVRCKQITDLAAESLAPVRVKARLPRGFQVTRITVDVLGICAACAAKDSSKQTLKLSPFQPKRRITSSRM